MITSGAIVQQIMNDINETNTTKFKPMILRAVSRAFKHVAGEHMWSSLIDTYSPSSTVVASQPILMPAPLIKIKSVRDDNYVYYKDRSNGRATKHPYNWYHADTVQTADILQEGAAAVATGATATKDSKVVTFGASITVDTDAAGEFVQLGEAEDSYEISTRDNATQVTLVENFRSETQQNERWEIRPRFTKRIRLVDYSNTAVTPSNLVIQYSRDPLTLIDYTYVVPIPNNAACVYLKALQFSMIRRGWNAAAQKLEPNYIHALGMAKKDDPTSEDTLKPLPMFRRPRRTRSDSLLSSIARGP